MPEKCKYCKHRVTFKNDLKKYKHTWNICSLFDNTIESLESGCEKFLSILGSIHEM